MIASQPNFYGTDYTEDCIVNLKIITQLQDLVEEYHITQITIKAKSFVGSPIIVDLSGCENLSKLDIKFKESTGLTFKLPQNAPNLFGNDRSSPSMRL